MSAVTVEKEGELRAEIGEKRDQIDRLEQDLSAVDEELRGLTSQHEQYMLLTQVCGSLERLESLGAGALFWDDEALSGRGNELLQRSRQRVQEFEEKVKAASAARESMAEKVAEGRGVLAILEDDWFDLKEQEEEQRNEWVIEREVDPASERRPAAMPWNRGGEEEIRLRKSMGSMLIAALLLGLLLPLIDLPVPEPSEIAEVPERLVELIRRDRQPVPPPPPAEEVVAEQPPPEEVVPESEPEPEPQQVAEQTPTEKPAEAPAPQEAPRERAKSSGILAFRESFASLADRPAARLGSDARINNAGEAAIGRPERSMVTTQAPGSSGGINLAALSRDVGGGGEGGGGQLAGVTATRVQSGIGPGGDGNGNRPLAGGSGVAGRTDEEIQIVFDRYKASLYRLYNRELRKTPTLQGQMVLKLTIEPDGSVSLCELQSTDMQAPELVQQVLDRVRVFDFGAKDVAAVTIIYPIDFLPAA